MTDDQFNQAMKAYADRTKAVEYVGHTIAALASVLAIYGLVLLVSAVRSWLT